MLRIGADRQMRVAALGSNPAGLRYHGGKRIFLFILDTAAHDLLLAAVGLEGRNGLFRPLPRDLGFLFTQALGIGCPPGRHRSHLVEFAGIDYRNSGKLGLVQVAQFRCGFRGHGGKRGSA